MYYNGITRWSAGGGLVGEKTAQSEILAATVWAK